MKDSEIRKRLKAAIRCLSAVLILSVVSGAVLLNSIGSTNGWGRTEKQEDEIYTKEHRQVHHQRPHNRAEPAPFQR